VPRACAAESSGSDSCAAQDGACGGTRRGSEGWSGHPWRWEHFLGEEGGRPLLNGDGVAAAEPCQPGGSPSSHVAATSGTPCSSPRLHSPSDSPGAEYASLSDSSDPDGESSGAGPRGVDRGVLGHGADASAALSSSSKPEQTSGNCEDVALQCAMAGDWEQQRGLAASSATDCLRIGVSQPTRQPANPSIHGGGSESRFIAPGCGTALAGTTAESAVAKPSPAVLQQMLPQEQPSACGALHEPVDEFPLPMAGPSTRPKEDVSKPSPAWTVPSSRLPDLLSFDTVETATYAPAAQASHSSPAAAVAGASAFDLLGPLPEAKDPKLAPDVAGPAARTELPGLPQKPMPTSRDFNVSPTALANCEATSAPAGGLLGDLGGRTASVSGASDPWSTTVWAFPTDPWSANGIRSEPAAWPASAQARGQPGVRSLAAAHPWPEMDAVAAGASGHVDAWWTDGGAAAPELAPSDPHPGSADRDKHTAPAFRPPVWDAWPSSGVTLATIKRSGG